MTDGGVAGERLHVMNRARVWSANQGPLNAAMLVAERGLKVVDHLAMTLETEVSRLDDAGVDRADCHLVDFLAGHSEERPEANGRPLRRGAGRAGRLRRGGWNRSGLCQG